jgi:phage shock protein C
MNMRGNRFETDRENGKIAGVCAGIANATGFDVTIIRIGFVLATILGGFPWTVIAYGVAAVIGKPRSHSSYAPARAVSTEEHRQRMRNIDLRMQAIETYVTSSNSSLAREIEELR